MWIDHSRTVVTKTQLLQLKALIRELQPECLVNSRLGLSLEEDPDVDFQTLGDNQFGSQKKEFPWQSPATVAHSWGFNSLDTEWKSTTSLLHSLISNVSLNGNLLLNIGPKANGDVPFEISQRLLEMGEWLKIYGESIYGSSAFDLQKTRHDWGMITSKKTTGGTDLYLHIFNWPFNNQLNISGIITKPESAYMLNDSEEAPLSYMHTGASTTINLQSAQIDPYVSVVVLKYSQKPDVEDGLVSKTTDDGYSCTPTNTSNPLNNLVIENKQRRGTIPSHVIISDAISFKWKIYVDKPGRKKIDVSYSFQGTSDKNLITVKSAGNSISQKVSPTGKTVGEANSNWVIDNFKSIRIGTINFPEKGYYDIDMEIFPADNEELKFQWLWLK